MMTGVLPFDGESMGEVLVKQVTALPPAPRGINPTIPPSGRADPAALPRQAARRAVPDHAWRCARRCSIPRRYLRGSPPIAPARSVAPGEAQVDARAVAGPRRREDADDPGLARRPAADELVVGGSARR